MGGEGVREWGGRPTYLCCAFNNVPGFDYMLVYILGPNYEMDMLSSVSGHMERNWTAGDWIPVADAISPSDLINEIIFRYEKDGEQDQEKHDGLHGWTASWHGFVNFNSLLCPDYYEACSWVFCPGYDVSVGHFYC